MSTRAEFRVTLGPSAVEKRRRKGDPLRILVWADLGSGGADALAAPRARRVTVDDLDRVLAESRPSITLADAADGRITLEVESLDELHPDHLVKAVPELRALLDLRARLANPATEQAALAELGERTGRAQAAPAAPSASGGSASAGTASAESGGSASAGSAGKASAATAAGRPASTEHSDDALFERLLGKPPSESSRAAATVRQLIEDAFATSPPSKPTSGLAAQARAEVVELLTARLRAVLCDRRFRAVERAWRSLAWLVSRLDEDEAEVHVLHLPKDELSGHLLEHGTRLEASPLHRLLAEDSGFDLIVADYTFALSIADSTLLASIGALATRAGATCIAHGDLTLAGCASAADAESPWDWSLPDDDAAALWKELRRHPAARAAALATPRFLLRHPYGRRSDPIESFPFEELPSRPERERFLWANPAFACALVAARAAAGASGDAAVLTADAGTVEDLPAPVYDDGSGEAVQPPVELLLGERARAAAMQAGLIVAAGGRNLNRLTFGGLFPIATDC